MRREWQGNHRLGWLLIVAGFGIAVWMDPWAFRTHNPSSLHFGMRVAMRQTREAVLTMAFLQLAFARIAASEASLPSRARTVAGITAIGALLYITGYAGAFFHPSFLWLAPIGAFLSLGGCLFLAKYSKPKDLRLVLLTIAFGLALEMFVGLLSVVPEVLSPGYLGGEDSVRMRMLRLALVAAVALPVLALLYRDLALRMRAASHRTVEETCLHFGMIGMPVVLTLAALFAIDLKYLLPIPALSIFFAAVIATLKARKQGYSLEFWGWLLITSSMGMGLLMGLYAFNGPLPSPAFLGNYNDFARRLSRLGHAYCILCGLLSIFLAQEIGEKKKGEATLVCVALLGTGVVVTLAVIQGVGAFKLPTSWLGIGPAIISVAIALCLYFRWLRRKNL